MPTQTMAQLSPGTELLPAPAPAACSQMHGGFGYGKDACVVVGEGREPITAALPLFINRHHWSVAQLHAKPLLGMMCTLSPLVSAAQRAWSSSPAEGLATGLVCLLLLHDRQAMWRLAL